MRNAECGIPSRRNLYSEFHIPNSKFSVDWEYNKMGRSLKKGPFVDDHLLIKIQVAKQTNNRKPIKTWSRRSTVTPEFVGMTFMVHNGTIFHSVYVTVNMVGH